MILWKTFTALRNKKIERKKKKRLKTRKYIIMEMISTEKSYINKLKLLENQIIIPL